jgi:hypothetical protein
MAKKQVIRLTEDDLHRIIKESVNRILKEGNFVDNESLSYDELYNHFLRLGFTPEGAQFHAQKRITLQQNNERKNNDNAYRITPDEMQRLNKLLQSND